MAYTIHFAPYRLDEGHVGEAILKPVYVSRHRTAKAARRALIRVITGTNPAAKEYLASSCRWPIALRYYAQRDCAPFKQFSATELKSEV
jgi:hypothetical protein